MSLRLRCIAIDDEPMALEALRIQLADIALADLVGTFLDAFAGLAYVHAHPVDVVFLDIQMPDINGLQLAQTLRGPYPMIIFTTAYSQYAVASYEVNAIDYLLKPIAFDRLLTAVSKAHQHYMNHRRLVTQPPLAPVDSPRYLFLRSGSELHKVDTATIRYIEAQGNYIQLVTPKQVIRGRLSLEDVLAQLPADAFIRIHRSFVIAFAQVDKIEPHQVTIAGQAIPIGNHYRQNLMDRLDSPIA